MNNRRTVSAKGKAVAPKKMESKEIKYHESPIERALRLSSEQVIAMAIRDLIKKDELN